MALLAGFQGGRRSVVATEYIVHLCGGDAGGSFPAKFHHFCGMRGIHSSGGVSAPQFSQLRRHWLVYSLGDALLIWQVQECLRPAILAIWLLLVALINVHNGNMIMVSGVLLTLIVLFGVHKYVPASSERLNVSRWFAPAYVLHLVMIAAVVIAIH